MKSAAQRAATAALLAASPLVAGISGAHWSKCRIAHGNSLLADEILAKRFWETSEQIVTAIRAADQIAPAQAGNEPVYMAGSLNHVVVPRTKTEMLERSSSGSGGRRNGTSVEPHG